MSLFDSDSSDQLLGMAFNKPSEKRSEQIIARRLCKVLGIDYSSLDQTASGKDALLAQVVERFIEMNLDSFKGIKGLLPGSKILASEVKRERPKTAYQMGAALRGMSY